MRGGGGGGGLGRCLALGPWAAGSTWCFPGECPCLTGGPVARLGQGGQRSWGGGRLPLQGGPSEPTSAQEVRSPGQVPAVLGGGVCPQQPRGQSSCSLEGGLLARSATAAPQELLSLGGSQACVPAEVWVPARGRGCSWLPSSLLPASLLPSNPLSLLSRPLHGPELQPTEETAERRRQPWAVVFVRDLGAGSGSAGAPSAWTGLRSSKIFMAVTFAEYLPLRQVPQHRFHGLSRAVPSWRGEPPQVSGEQPPGRGWRWPEPACPQAQRPSGSPQGLPAPPLAPPTPRVQIRRAPPSVSAGESSTSPF